MRSETLEVMAAANPVAEGPRPRTPCELQAMIQAERDGVTLFLYRDPAQELRIVRFDREHSGLTVGRNRAADLSIGWDDQVSALHAVLEQLAGEPTLLDDGMSRNGSWVNGERVHGRRRLRNGDILRFGRTLVLVRNPAAAGRRATSAALQPVLAADLSIQQRKVLIALCRPLRDRDAVATPPSNQQIADELCLSVPAIKQHLRALFEKFQVAELPHNKKRHALAARALQSDLIADRHSDAA